MLQAYKQSHDQPGPNRRIKIQQLERIISVFLDLKRGDVSTKKSGKCASKRQKKIATKKSAPVEAKKETFSNINKHIFDEVVGSDAAHAFCEYLLQERG